MGKFLKESAKASYMNPQFTTQAFPTHWSISTGSYIETHGIVGNQFYDPLFREKFAREKSTELKWWNESEPMWFGAVRHGIKTGVYFWPGCEAMFLNASNLYTRVTFRHNVPFNVKVNQSLKWLTEDNYKFVVVYHDQPDAISHKYGINSPEFNVTLAQLDKWFGYLIEQLTSRGLYDADDFNMIVLSDHGMVNIKRNVIINDYIDENDATIWSFSSNLIHLRPLINLNYLLTKLNRIPHVNIILKEDIPETIHYKHNRRIGDVLISATEGVGLIHIAKGPLKFNHNGQITSMSLGYEQKKQLYLASADRAGHGFDKMYPSMRGIFMGRGAMFKKYYSSEMPLDSVDVYPLICNILAIQCEKRNGSFERAKRFLKYEHKFYQERRILESVLNRAACCCSLRVTSTFSFWLFFSGQHVLVFIMAFKFSFSFSFY
jgi:hypothetical protein